MIRSLLLTLVLLGSAGPMRAEVNRCPDGKGGVLVTGGKCPVVEPATPPAPEPPCRLTKAEKDAAIRREDQFLRRYPDRQAHRRSWDAALQQVVDRLATAQARLAELRHQRAAIDKERQFYENKPLPAALQAELDASEAKFAALADVFRGLEAGIVTIEARNHCEVRTFATRWAPGSAPGSSACDKPACALH